MWPDEWKAKWAGMRHRKGLTLFEVLIVMSVLAVLVSLVIGLGRHADAAGKRSRARADLVAWQETLTRWHLAFDEYPSVDGSVNNLLAASMRTPATNLLFREIAGAVPTNDPWGSPYQYRGTNQTYSIWSPGPDGRRNTPDDISPDVGN